MKKHKSKSNIMINNKETEKFSELVKKQKLKNQLCHKSTAKPSHNCKNIQSKSIYPQKATIMHSKTKSYLEKMTIVLPQQNLKNQHQNPNVTHRRKSVSAVSQRVESRFSKRGSIESNKDKKNENFKENDKNYLNLEQVPERQNQQIGTSSKKKGKNLQNKKKLSLNSNPKIKDPYEAFLSQKIFDQKSQNYQKFEHKMSQYLDSKDIFSRKVSQQKSNHSKQSKKSLSQKKISQKGTKFQQQKSSSRMKNKEKQNLLEIYQFYKKTFDINFNNCFKKGKNMTKIDKNPQNSSKSALKPFYSSIDKHQNENSSNKLKPFFKSINQTKISVSGVLNQNESLGKSKRSGSVSICNKENDSKVILQKSSFLNCRSKSNVNSDSSTKDNLFYWKGDQQNIDINNFDAKKQKKSFKDLIVFNEKVSNNFSAKDEILFEGCQYGKIKQKVEEYSEFSKISIGQSNIEVLRWQKKGQKQLDKVQNQLILSDRKKLQSSGGKLQEKIVSRKEKMEQSPSNQKGEQVNKNMVMSSIKISRQQEQQLNVTKLIKKASKQICIEDLEDLSSISLVNDRKDEISQNLFSSSQKMKQRFEHIDDIDFQF